jgi:hypothetical protein
VVVSWADTGSYTLKQTSSLATPNWTTPGPYNVTTAHGSNSVTLTIRSGNLFFSLHNP